jgi:hypothetical protein
MLVTFLVLFTGHTLLLPFTSGGCCAHRLCTSHIKSLKDRQYSFSKLAQFKLLNKVLDPLSCKVCGSAPGHRVILPSLLGQYCTKMMFLTLQNAERQVVTLLKLDSSPTAKLGSRPSCFSH